MKIIVMLVVLAAAGYFAYTLLQKPAAQQVIKAPENYAKSLAQDEKRAADAAAKANAAVAREVQAVNKVVEEGEAK